ncbi:putative Annexin B10 [Hypsibius exemplaris]|uniref:Annexin B10 n=1 Tax=Hypsibius exemplaris TaxID=2072580 RepID=A0A1W0WIS8_HYPEX|nr:putative Annexin B10 [Hypsibius exemplaris]
MPRRKPKEAVDLFVEPKVLDAPVVRDLVPFDARLDADQLQMALQGINQGSNELEIIELITHRSNRQRQDIAAVFAAVYDQDLVDYLKVALGLHMENVITALFLLPDVYDAVALHEALEGELADEATLVEIVCTRSNAELLALRDAYTTLYQRDLVSDFHCKSDGDFRRLLMSIILGIRDEDPDETIDPIQLRDQARMEAQLLFEPISEKLSAVQFSSTFVLMFSNPSHLQLRYTFREFEKIVKMETEKVISRFVTSNVAYPLLALVRIAKNKNAYFADLLFQALQNSAVDEKRLIRLIVSRSEKDLGNIKTEFQNAYRISMDTAISGDNSYSYRSVLSALIRD